MIRGSAPVLMRSRSRWSLAPIALSLLVTACGPKKTPEPAIPAAIRTPKATGEPTLKSGEGTLPGTVVARLEQGTVGPYVAAKDDSGLLVFVSPEKEGRVFRAAPLDAHGSPTSPPRVVGKAPEGLQSFSLRPLERGYLAIWTRTTSRGYAVETAAFGDDGSIGAQSVITESLDAAIWADAAKVPGGAHVYFAAPKGDDATISAVTVGLEGKPQGSPSVIADVARAWQVSSLGQGSALAMVEPVAPFPDKDKDKDKDRGQGREGTAVVYLVGPSSSALTGKKIALSAPGSAAPDLDAVLIDDRLVLAYTDKGSRDARVHLGAVSASGVVEKPRPVVLSSGDQAMLSLVAPGAAHGPLLLVWEDAAVKGPSGRRVLLSAVSGDLGRPLATATLDLGTTDETVPLFVPDKDGFAGLFLARACLTGAATCTDAKVTPTVARLSADLSPTFLSPYFPAATDGAVPDLAWGLSCTAVGCFALSADDTGSVASSRLEAGSKKYRSPFATRSRGGKPRVVAAESIAEGPSFGDAGVAKVGSGYLLATLTNHPEGAAPPGFPPDVDARSELAKDKRFGKKAPRSAIVTVRPLDAAARPLTGPGSAASAAGTTLTVRGLTAGGVAIASNTSGTDACVAWVARDDGDPEVFVTRVGADGKKQKQTLLTHAKGEIGDVAIVAAEDGWLVVWIDTRDGNAELYAARVDHELRKKGPETRLTNAPGDATEVNLFGREGDALVTFSDTRGAEKEATGAPFVLRVGLADGKKIGEEIRLARSSGAGRHARGVRIVPQGKDLLALWSEHPHPSDRSNAATPISFVHLDGNGAPKGLPETLTIEGDPVLSAFSVSCATRPCRVVGAKAEGSSLVVFGGTWSGEEPTVRTEDIGWLRAGPSLDPVPMLVGDQLLLLDDGPSRDGRVKRFGLTW